MKALARSVASRRNFHLAFTAGRARLKLSCGSFVTRDGLRQWVAPGHKSEITLEMMPRMHSDAMTVDLRCQTLAAESASHPCRT